MRDLDYQAKAVRRLIENAEELLKLQGNKTIVFKAPTGSGKTMMMAEFMKQFVERRGNYDSYAFLWAAPRQLHKQSKEKLQRYYENNMILKCSFYGDLNNKMIGENEILFLNWESINKENNIFYKDNEYDFNLEHVIENTIDAGRIITLIIDESHHTAKAENTQGLVKIINAKISIEVSATPRFSNYDRLVSIDREDVIAEEMIKRSIAINPDFKNIITGESIEEIKIKSSAEESTNEFVLKTAIAKRNHLAKLYQESGSNINPLLLIQLPDRREGHLDIKDDIIAILKHYHNITVENDKLSIYLSEEKENLAAITKNDCPVEVMIFKQAIALGWDCPRASILVLFRDWKSIVFSIQTLGRIMRMPELKHYSNEELNTGYVYTNLSDISIHQDIAGSYATTNCAERKPIYENISLSSVHSKRQRERTRLALIFIDYFLKATEEENLKEKINIDIKKIRQKLISNGVVENIDREFEHIDSKQIEAFDTHKADIVERELNDEDVQIHFDNFVIESLSPLYPEERSVGRIQWAIYSFFKNEFTMQFDYMGMEAQMIVLAPQNRQYFLDVINKAKDAYLNDMLKKDKELVSDVWDVPKSVNYSNEYGEKSASLCIMDKFFEYKNASSVEKKFLDYIDGNSEVIEWWFKNGARDATFFAVPCVENNNPFPFYVDWIVKFKDGRIGLFDTKKGWTAKDAKTRAEGLAKYIEEENAKGKNFFGGIVLEKDASFWINSNRIYEYDFDNLSGTGWKILSV